MLEEWDNIEIIAENLFPKLSLNFATNQTHLCENVKSVTNLQLYGLIEQLTEYGNNVSKHTDNNVDKPYNDKLVKMYEDSIVRETANESQDQVQFTSFLESKTTSDIMILKQIKTIDERNVESAIKSLELSFLHCDNVLAHRIENSAKSMEHVIPQMNRNLSICRSEFSESHNSLELLDAAVYGNYCVLRDGYQHLLQKYYSESAVQMSVTNKLELEKNKWHLSKLQHAINFYRSSSERNLDRQRMSEEYRAQFSNACDSTYIHLLKHNNFEEAEDACRRLEVVRSSVYDWKSRLVSHCEEALNTAVGVQEACFLAHLEELMDTLQALRSMQPRMYCYQKTLEHNCEILRKLHEQELQASDALEGRLSVDDHEMFGGATDENEAAMRAMEIEEDTLRMGTRLHATALALGMGPDEVEQLLLQMLPSGQSSS